MGTNSEGVSVKLTEIFCDMEWRLAKCEEPLEKSAQFQAVSNAHTEEALKKLAAGRIAVSSMLPHSQP